MEAMETRTADRRPPLADTPLGQTIATTATDIWNDSCAVDELEYASLRGGGRDGEPDDRERRVESDPGRWRGRIRELARERADATEVDLAWAVVEEMSSRGGAAPASAFEEHGGRQGRLSMQTDPALPLA